MQEELSQFKAETFHLAGHAPQAEMPNCFQLTCDNVLLSFVTYDREQKKKLFFFLDFINKQMANWALMQSPRIFQSQTLKLTGTVCML